MISMFPDLFLFFFFKQKTAYEVRISDWSSDVCSSDLWIFGLMLAFNIDAWTQGWFHAKLLLVIILSGYHGWVVGYSKKLAKGLRPFSDKKLRMLNEVPGILAALIVVLAVVKPF